MRRGGCAAMKGVADPREMDAVVSLLCLEAAATADDGEGRPDESGVAGVGEVAGSAGRNGSGDITGSAGGSGGSGSRRRVLAPLPTAPDQERGRRGVARTMEGRRVEVARKRICGKVKNGEKGPVEQGRSRRGGRTRDRRGAAGWAADKGWFEGSDTVTQKKKRRTESQPRLLPSIADLFGGGAGDFGGSCGFDGSPSSEEDADDDDEECQPAQATAGDELEAPVHPAASSPLPASPDEEVEELRAARAEFMRRIFERTSETPRGFVSCKLCRADCWAPNGRYHVDSCSSVLEARRKGRGVVGEGHVPLPPEAAFTRPPVAVRKPGKIPGFVVADGANGKGYVECLVCKCLVWAPNSVRHRAGCAYLRGEDGEKDERETEGRSVGEGSPEGEGGADGRSPASGELNLFCDESLSE